jgi:hypothetical protein
MSTIVSTVEAIKRAYLNITADLVNLSTLLEAEMEELRDSPLLRWQAELDSLSRLLVTDIKTNNTRCAEVARLHNKISPPLYIHQKRRTVPYLIRVK